jgi:four helix bundle protein
MSEISDAIQAKCLAFGDRIIKLNDYLLEQASLKYDVRCQKYNRGSKQHQPSDISHHTSRVPVHLQAVAVLCNQLLRAGTSIGANNSEACNAISRQDFRSKSYIALKEARESLYWIELLHRNGYLDDKQYQSIYADCEELVKILVTRCKKLDEQLKEEKK